LRAHLTEAHGIRPRRRGRRQRRQRQARMPAAQQQVATAPEPRAMPTPPSTPAPPPRVRVPLPRMAPGPYVRAEPQVMPAPPPLIVPQGAQPVGPTLPTVPGFWQVCQDYRQYPGGGILYNNSWMFTPDPSNWVFEQDNELGPEPELEVDLSRDS
jgi:hypothetical protein